MAEQFNNLDTDQTNMQREDLPIRAAPRRVSGLRRRTIRLAFALLAAVVAVALIVGLGIGRHSRRSNESRRIEPPPANVQPSPIADLPSSYADVPQLRTLAPPPKHAPTPNARHEATTASMAAVAQMQKRDLSKLLASIKVVVQKNRELARQVAAYQSQVNKAQDKAWSSALFFKVDELSHRGQAEHPTDASGTIGAADVRNASKHAYMPEVAETSPQSSSAARAPTTDQQRKLAFLNDSAAPQLGVDRSSLSPVPGDGGQSGYLLQAGTVVPAALLTGINTDLPGDVVATITKDVCDSPTGNHLLIPQGAKLYGSYDSQIAASQNRALLVWHRLLLPDGQSMNLGRMSGTDAAGYAGLSDRVDYHLDKLATASLLSGVIAYAGNLAGGRQGVNLTAGNVIGDAIAQQASTVGSNVVQRELNVQPTITIRPGWPVRVLVNRDFLLPAYAN